MQQLSLEGASSAGRFRLLRSSMLSHRLVCLGGVVSSSHPKARGKVSENNVGFAYGPVVAATDPSWVWKSLARGDIVHSPSVICSGVRSHNGNL